MPTRNVTPGWSHPSRRRQLRRTQNIVFFVGMLSGTLVLSIVLTLRVPVTPMPMALSQSQLSAAVSYSQLSRKAAITEYLSEKFKKTPEIVRQMVDYAWDAAAKHKNVTPELILAVIQKESSLRIHARSGYGAEGLMQVVPRWHPEKLHPGESLYDLKVNIRVGAAILQEYIDKEGQLAKALVKYSANAGGYPDFVITEMERLQNI